MRSSFALGLALTVLGSFSGLESRGQSAGRAGAAVQAKSASSARDSSLKPYATRDMRAFVAQKPAYSRQNPPAPTVDKRSRAAVFAKGVRDYYPAARSNQAKNSNVIDPRSLCVPGRRALLQR